MYKMPTVALCPMNKNCPVVAMINNDRIVVDGLNQRFKRKKIATELAIERITAGALIVNKLTPNSLKNNN